MSDKLIKLGCLRAISLSRTHLDTMHYTRERTESIHYMSKPSEHHRSRAIPHPQALPNRAALVSDEPWQHMAQTYTWVLQQQEEKLKNKNKKTETWVIAQRSLLPQRSHETSAQQKMTGIMPPRKSTWNELLTGDGVDAEARWTREAARESAAVEREREKSLAMDEEIKRIQARAQKKKAQERSLLAAQRVRMAERDREKEREKELERARQESARVNIASSEAWRVHESRWATISEGSEPLKFRTIPWPLVSRPSNSAEIIPTGIVAFLLSPLHSPAQSRKNRIRMALLRWHPDRFQKFLSRVSEKDRQAVSDGVGIVARCLNELMEKETRAIRRKF